VTIIHQFDKLTANRQAQEKIFKNPKVTFLYDNEPREFRKEGYRIVTITENIKTGVRSSLESDGVLIFIGMKPNTDLFKQKLEMDKWGFIKADEDMRTNIRGVYAVGDVISKKYRQITTAVAEGTIAAMAIAKELE